LRAAIADAQRYNARDDEGGPMDETPHLRRRRRPFAKLLLAGFIATSVMNLLMFLPRVANWPGTDSASLLAQVLPGESANQLNWNWWLGAGWHYLNGMVIFPLIFAFALDPWLPGHRVLRGLWFGLGLWLLMEAVFLPLVGAGVFARGVEEPLKFSLIYLLGHLGYGLFLGGMAGAKGGVEARLDLARRSTRRLTPAAV
jgi:hypothetical protein